jgi:hypothetical protein
MSFQDLPAEVTDERIVQMRREAEVYRRALPARRESRTRARRRWSLRRHAASVSLSTIARAANKALGAIISPAWPASDAPRRYAGR